MIGKPKDTLKKAEEFNANFTLTNKGVVLNVDNDENRRLAESCYRTRKTIINPIIDWTEAEVWAF